MSSSREAARVILSSAYGSVAEALQKAHASLPLEQFLVTRGGVAFVDQLRPVFDKYAGKNGTVCYDAFVHGILGAKAYERLGRVEEAVELAEVLLRHFH